MTPAPGGSDRAGGAEVRGSGYIGAARDCAHCGGKGICQPEGAKIPIICPCYGVHSGASPILPATRDRVTVEPASKDAAIALSTLLTDIAGATAKVPWDLYDPDENDPHTLRDNFVALLLDARDVLATRPAPDAAAGVTDEDLREAEAQLQGYVVTEYDAPGDRLPRVIRSPDRAACLRVLGAIRALAADRHRAAPAREGQQGEGSDV